jgi:hypothetical protein
MNSGAESNIVAIAVFPRETISVADHMPDPFATVP